VTITIYDEGNTPSLEWSQLKGDLAVHINDRRGTESYGGRRAYV